jgi:hypothetical protein
LDATGVHQPESRARALFAYLVGTIVQQLVDPAPFEVLRPAIERIAQLEN